MSYEVYKVRRRFQYMGWVYAKPGPCDCSSNPGSNVVTTRVSGTTGKAETGQFDKNPCQDLSHCTGQTATECQCNDSGYCSCSIKPWMYGGDIWLVQEADPRKEHVLMRRFAVYDPTLSTADELMKQDKYRMLVQGEPNPEVVYFPPKEVIQGLITDVEITEVVLTKEELAEKALAAAQAVSS